MRAFFDQAQHAHAPAQELHNGGWVPHAEAASRVQSILDAIGPVENADDHGMAAILAVHDADYVEFLRTAHARWLAAGRKGDAIGYVWPAVRRRAVSLDRIDALLGRYSIDAGTPIASGTWQAVYGGAQSALSALAAVQSGGRNAFALCRPPGHHAGADYLGGYSYLNNAAIVAQAARDAGAGRVAVLDIDYHHGNGTQDIFYARGDVLYVSIHADPATDYPFFWGHADERGEGDGEGATLNLPLPHGTRLLAYREALRSALGAITDFAPDLLVTSYGADTFAGDPISHFAIETADYAVLGSDIAGLALPNVIVMEGGYAIDALGANVSSFLSGFGD